MHAARHSRPICDFGAGRCSNIYYWDRTALGRDTGIIAAARIPASPPAAAHTIRELRDMRVSRLLYKASRRACAAHAHRHLSTPSSNMLARRAYFPFMKAQERYSEDLTITGEAQREREHTATYINRIFMATFYFRKVSIFPASLISRYIIAISKVMLSAMRAFDIWKWAASRFMILMRSVRSILRCLKEMAYF